MTPWFRAVLALTWLLACRTEAQTVVQDIFGRTLNQHGITLVDWDGYMADPLLKFYFFPPTNAPLPGSATLTANGPRLYFDNPSSVSSNGPSKTISFGSHGVGVATSLSVFPDRDSLAEDYTLTIVFTASNNARQTNTVPIHVLDLDLQRTNDFVVTKNFGRDITGFFTNATRRALVAQASGDWTYFFAGMGLDPVAIGSETTYIWSNNFSGGYFFSNTNGYTGYQLYAYGTTNSIHRSGGEASYSGPVQSSNGVPLTIKRSGGFEAEIYGNYNTLGWLLLTNDNDWLVNGNLGTETNDFYSIAHHEIGHALIFNEAHPGFNTAKAKGAFTSTAVTNYYGGPVAIDASDHLNGAIDPESGQGAFGYEYYGNIPRKRWLITKLDLLCAQEVGYVLRTSAAFTPLSLPALDPVGAFASVPFSVTYGVSGGIPVYNWDVVGGALPPGLTLDPFTGTVAGTPTISGTFNFTLRVRDYHEGSAGVTRPTAIAVASAPQPQLAITISGQGAAARAQLTLYGTTGQQQIIQSSPDLSTWAPIATNSLGANLYPFLDPSPLLYPGRFYRALVVP
jgi:hypothetical protein